MDVINYPHLKHKAGLNQFLLVKEDPSVQRKYWIIDSNIKDQQKTLAILH